jgi:hypothetical protein
MYTISRYIDGSSERHSNMMNPDFIMIRLAWSDSIANDTFTGWLLERNIEHENCSAGHFVKSISFKDEKDFLVFKLKYC